MITYEAYINIQKQYVNGLKSINQKNSYPSVSVYKEFKAKLEATTQSYKAYYNEKGKLIHLNNLHTRSKFKYSYFYDSKYRVSKILEINKETNVLSKENNIIYKDNLNFVEHIKEYIGGTFESPRELHHSKEYDSICVEQKNVSVDEWYLFQTLEFDDYIEEIFDTNRGWQEVSIYELNKNKQVTKSYFYSFDYVTDAEVIESEDKYEPKDYYLHQYYSSGLIKSDSFVSDEPWTKTYEYKFNDKGHWIERVTWIDNSLQYICERQLEYF